MRTSSAGLMFVMAFAGCGDPGPPTGTVKGKLTIGGQAPSEPVMITFVNSTIGSGGNAQTDAEGAFDIPLPMLVGEHTVYVNKIVQSEGPVSTNAEILSEIPSKYATEGSSPLRKEVKEGENTIDIDIPKK